MKKVLFLLVCVFALFALTACQFELPEFVDGIIGNDTTNDENNDDNQENEENQDNQTEELEHEHEYTWTVQQDADCTIDGFELGTCSCGETTTRTITAKGHVSVVIAGTAATCTTPGLTDKVCCSVCEAVLQEAEEIPAGHQVVEVPAVAATCELAGLTAGSKCSLCDEVLVAQEVVPALGHTAEEIPAVDASCSSAGSTAGSKCSACDTVLVEPEIIDATGHTPGAEATWASSQTCTVCNDVINEQVTSVTIYYYNSLGWELVNLYAWTETVDHVVAWPGAAMTAAPEVGDNWYSYVVTASSLVGLNIIFNNGSAQTADLAVVEGNYYYYGKVTTGYASVAEVEEAIIKEQEQPKPAGVTLYLKPNSNWTQSNARYALYTWDGGDQWFDFTDADGDGIYEVVIPEGISNIIFCRMNPGTTANNWNNKWNQTADLKVPTDGTNLYTVKENTWDKGGGTWSIKE